VVAPSVNGVRGNDLQRNSRVGGTLSIKLDRRQSLKFAYSRGAFTTIGADFQTLSVAYQYLWGRDYDGTNGYLAQLQPVKMISPSLCNSISRWPLWPERQGLSPVNTYSILQDQMGAISVGTWNDGVSRNENGRFTHFRLDSNVGPLKWVTALAEDRAGRLWIAALSSSMGWFNDWKCTINLCRRLTHPRPG